MSPLKLGMLAFYVVLGVLGVIYTGTALGDWSLGILAVLAVAHLIEMAVFYKRCQQAGGSLATHMLNVFLFGVVHMRELDKPG